MTLSRREFVSWAALACPTSSRAQAGVDVRVIQVFEAINDIRRRRHLAKLEWDDRVAAEARTHAENMARRKFFSHEDPVRGDLKTRLSQSGIAWSYCAENIFQEQGHRDLGGVAVKSWMDSSGHRANILNPNMTRTGIGLATRSDGSHWLDQIFIRPAPPTAANKRD